MFGFFKNTEKKIAKRQIRNNIRTAKQIIKELPESEMKRNGGLNDLIKRTQVNIAGSLLGYGLVCQSVAVYSINSEKLKTLDCLDREVWQAVNKC
jgi:hypothetical protein